MKKYIVFAILILFVITSHAQTQSLNICDGPYVSYRGDQIIVRAIDSNDKATIDSFPVSQKAKHPIQIHFSNHENFDFQVSLRNAIINEQDSFKGADKIFALSDIEGEFENFRALLIGNGVINEKYEWTFAKGAVVICGDLFDRGQDVAAELWLLYKLEDEAREKGGYVHTILGNHDIMNMSGDLRYVQQKYFDHAKAMDLPYMELYDKDSEVGRWLRSKNIIEKIGDNLYLHGGISPEVLSLQWPISKINYACRPFYDETKHPGKMTDSSIKTFMGRNGLFWYRGYFMDPRATQSMVDSILITYNAKHIIVGHTITDSNIASYYEGKIIGIDVNEHEEHTQAILLENNTILTTDPTGKKRPVSAGPAKPVVE